MDSLCASQNSNEGKVTPVGEIYTRATQHRPSFTPQKSVPYAPIIGLLKSYFQFGVVGASGVVIDMAALFVLADPRMLDWNLSLSKALAAEIAIFSNFTWNELWTFRELAQADPTWSGRAVRFGKFNLICLAGIAISILLLAAQTRFFGINVYVGNLIAVVIVSLWNFGVNRRFGWTERTSIALTAKGLI
jgi:putative flippase GtrA